MILQAIKKLFETKPCECKNCIENKSPTHSLSYKPCEKSHPTIKLAHHRALMKTKAVYK
tara:strand:+ start:326 stop:502 length:177 start_codon:yes stop_codon:yes gene_type:complete